MCAIQRAISKYVECGVDMIEAAAIVAEVLAQASGKVRSAGAIRTARYRERKASQTVTKRDESVTGDSVTKRDETVTKRHSVTSPLSIEDSSKKERKRDRGARLSEEWKPTPEDFAEAQRSLGGAALGELAKFRDHWKQQPGSRGVKLDWDATWRNWVRRATEYRHRNSPQKPNGLEGLA
jgi:hypothetical protein